MKNLSFLTDSACNLLQKIIRIPAYSFNENERADYIFNYIKDRAEALNNNANYKEKIIVKRLENNIIAYRDNFSDKKKTLMLNSHIDTVTPVSSYTFNPHEPFVKDNCIFGLGSNDDGGSVVSQINTFFYLNGENGGNGGNWENGENGENWENGGNGDAPQLNVNLIFVLTAEEERSGSKGIDLVMKELSGSKIMPNFAIIGEPTSMEAAVAERGLLVIDATSYGVSGHAGRNEGVNALYKAIDDINILRNYKFEKHSALMGDVKMTVTQLNCGTAHNVIPCEASFVVDIRPTEQYTNTEIFNLLQTKVQSSLKARNLTNRTSATPKDHILYSTLNKLNINTYISPTTSDWMRLTIPAIKMGPGESARSHKADEFIKIEEIEKAISAYINFITNI